MVLLHAGSGSSSCFYLWLNESAGQRTCVCQLVVPVSRPGSVGLTPGKKIIQNQSMAGFYCGSTFTHFDLQTPPPDKPLPLQLHHFLL